MKRITSNSFNINKLKFIYNKILFSEYDFIEINYIDLNPLTSSHMFSGLEDLLNLTLIISLFNSDLS